MPVLELPLQLGALGLEQCAKPRHLAPPQLHPPRFGPQLAATRTDAAWRRPRRRRRLALALALGLAHSLAQKRLLRRRPLRGLIERMHARGRLRLLQTLVRARRRRLHRRERRCLCLASHAIIASLEPRRSESMRRLHAHALATATTATAATAATATAAATAAAAPRFELVAALHHATQRREPRRSLGRRGVAPQP